MKNSGLSIHCHHDILIEYCYDYQERVDYIKKEKPEAEIAIRLKLFKLLSTLAMADLPKGLVKACTERKKANAKYWKACTKYGKVYAEYNKANAKYGKACTEWNKANDKYNKALAEYDKAYVECSKAYAEWDYEERVTWHKKWCGCKEWNGKEMVFNQV